MNGHTMLTPYHALACSLFALLIAVPGHAATWKICQLEASITRTIVRPHPKLVAQIVRVTPQSADAQCPSLDSTIQFIPESRDYQSTLPRKRWPTSGQHIKLRYQYLDGLCKHDGANEPCRIEHYPMGW